VSDYVREVTSPAKFGSDPISGQDATWRTFVRTFDLFHYVTTINLETFQR